MAKRKAIDTNGTNSSPLASSDVKKRLGTVERVNALPASEIQKHYVDEHLLLFTPSANNKAESFHIDFMDASQLTKGELNVCFNLIDSTSRQDYEASSFGWHPKRKRREMMAKEMRYLLLRSSAEQSPQDGSSSSLKGFLSFMFDHDSTPSVPVLYVYEIHLSNSIRRLGLGAHLMEIAESLAKNVGVEKVMLTCFVSNFKARAFYETHGYGTDVCSPKDRTIRRKVVKTDYVIMSKDVPK